jgi:hypothetical protein
VTSCRPSFVPALLLAGQRREDVSRMRWEEIEGETWDPRHEIQDQN